MPRVKGSKSSAIIAMPATNGGNGLQEESTENGSQPEKTTLKVKSARNKKAAAMVPAPASPLSADVDAEILENPVKKATTSGRGSKKKAVESINAVAEQEEVVEEAKKAAKGRGKKALAEIPATLPSKELPMGRGARARKGAIAVYAENEEDEEEPERNGVRAGKPVKSTVKGRKKREATPVPEIVVAAETEDIPAIVSPKEKGKRGAKKPSTKSGTKLDTVKESRKKVEKPSPRSKTTPAKVVDAAAAASKPSKTVTELKPAGKGKKRALTPVATDFASAAMDKELSAAEDDQPIAGGSKKKRKATVEKADPVKPGKASKTVAEQPKARGGRKRAAVAEEDTTSEAEQKQDGDKPSKVAKKAPMNATATTYVKSDFEITRPLTELDAEEPFNLKISSWNVAGLRSWLKKDGLEFLTYEDPDIFCMQEIKCTEDQLPEEAARLPGYHPYWLCLPGGHAGVAIYSKIMPIHVEYGIGDADVDAAAGRVITAEYEKFYLVNVYVPNSGRKLVNLDSRMRWEQLFQEHIQKLDDRKPVVVCGDMNVSHEEIDLANPKTNTRNAGFTREERDKMSDLLALGYVDTFRHLYPQRKGAYTFWTYMGSARGRNVGWRLDYFIVSQRIIERVVDNCIRAQCLGSDHCPITLYLKL